MYTQPPRYKYEFKRKVYTGLALFFLVVVGAGCASTPPQEEGPYLKIQGGQDSGGVTWSK